MFRQMCDGRHAKGSAHATFFYGLFRVDEPQIDCNLVTMARASQNEPP
jgi:hypothetical protein